MASWNHEIVPLDDDEKLRGCRSCRGDWETKPRAEFALRYEYTTGPSGRSTWARRGMCATHAESTAKRWGLQLELLRIIRNPMEVEP